MASYMRSSMALDLLLRSERTGMLVSTLAAIFNGLAEVGSATNAASSSMLKATMRLSTVQSWMLDVPSIFSLVPGLESNLARFWADNVVARESAMRVAHCMQDFFIDESFCSWYRRGRPRASGDEER